MSQELSLAKALSKDAVGFNCGNVITSTHLRKPLEFDSSLFENLKDLIGVQSAFSVDQKSIQSPINYINQQQNVGSAYLGWLIQQPAYWEDLSFMQEEYKSEIQAKPFPQPLLDNGQTVESKVETSADAKSFFETVQDVCRRWRISSFLAIECPILKTPKTSGIFDNSIPDGEHKPQLPDIYPIEGSGPHVDQMNERRKFTLRGHLDGWAKISAKAGKNTRPYDSLARQYQIQHLLRLMESRFLGCLRRKRAIIQPILAAYFEMSEATLKRDFKALDASVTYILNKKLEVRF